MTRAHLLAAATAVGFVALPSVARADGPLAGSTTITTNGAVAVALKAQGVRITATGAATLTRGRLTVPVTAGRVGTTATVSHRGAGIRLSRRQGMRTRTLTITAPTIGLRGTRSTVTAVVGNLRRTVFTIIGHPTLDASRGTARVRGGRLVLTLEAAGRVRRALGLRSVPAGSFGTIALEAATGATAAPVVGGVSTPTPGAPGTPQAPVSDGLPRLTRPATATTVTSASLAWHVRDSFVNYMLGGGGGGTATAPAMKNTEFDFGFTTVTDGWYDAASGTAAVSFAGTVRFRYPGRFDFTAADPEIEINGAASRAIFRFNGQGASTFDNRRGVLVDLWPLPAPTDTGPTRTYAGIPGAIPQGTSQSVFGDFYIPGDKFGNYTISFSTA